MDASIGHLAKPAPGSGIGGVTIRNDAGLLHAGGERYPEAALQTTDEALNLTLRLGPIGTTQTRQEACMARIIEKAGMETMPPAP
jgi:hypothetical protein